MVFSVRILIATHHYRDLAGSELFAFTLAKSLFEKGHSVCLYSPYIGGIITDQTRRLGIPVYSDLVQFRHIEFNIMHVSHNIIAYEARYHFQHTPMVFLSHGILPFLEQPPVGDLGISKYLAVSEEVMQNLLRKGIPLRDVAIFRNIVDTGRFFPTQPLNPRAKRALIFSRKFDETAKRVIKEACKLKRISVETINGSVFDVENYMNRADIIFSRGRGAIEAMSTGKIVIIPGDGLVTEKNFREIQKCNFSGRRFQKPLDVAGLKDEIDKYDQILGEDNRRIVLKYFSANHQVDELTNIYREAINRYEDENIDFSELVSLIGPRMELSQVKQELSEIKHSAGYKFMKFYASHIDQLFPDGTSRGHLRRKLTNYVTRQNDGLT